MTTTTADFDAKVRVIRGRTIEKSYHGGAILWRVVNRSPPIEKGTLDPSTGETRYSIEYVPDQVLWEAACDPDAVLGPVLLNCWPDPLDPRPPSPVHSQLEQAENAGFGDLAAALRMAAKIKPREPLGGMFNLGPVYVSRGLRTIGGEDLSGDT